MSDITRDDLSVVTTLRDHSKPCVHAGAVRSFEGGWFTCPLPSCPGGAIVQLEEAEPIPDKALRALLTDECDCVGWGQGAFRDAEPHGPCGGRGWLPKDGVMVARSFNAQGDVILTLEFPADWLNE